jgi:hypothetical protein
VAAELAENVRHGQTDGRVNANRLRGRDGRTDGRAVYGGDMEETFRAELLIVAAF